MKNALIAKKSAYFLDNYLSSNEIYCLKRSKIESNSVLILPNKYSEENYYYASESINLAKYLLVYEHFGSIDFLDNENLNVRDLHSFDIWLGTLYIVNHLLVPIILSITANYIFDRLKGREHQKANVDFKLIYMKNGESKEIYYNGPAKEFIDLVEKVNLKDL